MARSHRTPDDVPRHIRLARPFNVLWLAYVSARATGRRRLGSQSSFDHWVRRTAPRDVDKHMVNVMVGDLIVGTGLSIVVWAPFIYASNHIGQSRLATIFVLVGATIGFAPASGIPVLLVALEYHKRSSQYKIASLTETYGGSEGFLLRGSVIAWLLAFITAILLVLLSESPG